MRSTEAEVKAIMNTALTEEQITPFLRAANVSVTAVCTDPAYSSGEMREIECALAAHLVTARDPQVTKETQGQTTTEYEGGSGEGLQSTRYGRMVLTMDRLGSYAKIQKGEAVGGAEIYVLG